jgi:protease II
MKYGVTYTIKHSGAFFFKMTNEEDLINNKIVKIPIPSKYKELVDPSKASEYTPKTTVPAKITEKALLALPGNRSISLPTGPKFSERSTALEVVSKSPISLLQPSEVTKTKFDAKILDFEVFEHYLAVVEERNSVEKLKTMTLKNDRWHTVTQTEDFYHLSLQDNYTYNSQFINYSLETPHHPKRVIQHNMGTHLEE